MMQVKQSLNSPANRLTSIITKSIQSETQYLQGVVACERVCQRLGTSRPDSVVSQNKMGQSAPSSGQ